MNTKKVLMIILLIVVVGVIGIALVNANNKSIGSTTQNGANNGKMIEITDNFFIEQTNDIYLNVNDYIGKTIKIEGLIYSYEGENGEKCYAVVRNTPGCCGADGLAGLDIRQNEEYPEVNTWVEVTGFIGEETMYGSKIPIIKVSSLTPKEAGKTFVTN